MRVVVTGKGGQVSSALEEAARGRDGIELIVVGQPEFDLERPETIAAALERTHPDLVINAAAYTAVDAAEDEPERAFAVNAAGAAEVARYAARAGIPLIQLSTDYVFDGSSEVPYGEEAPTNPLNVYGRSKLEGEELMRDAAPDHVIIRTAWVYSPFGNNFVKTMIDLARSRDEVRVVADQRGSPTSALDLADALLKVVASIDRAIGRTFHIAGTGSCTWAELAEEVFEVSRSAGGPNAGVKPISTAQFGAKARRPANSMLDCGLFERTFGYRMPEWRESVATVVRRLVS